MTFVISVLYSKDTYCGCMALEVNSDYSQSKVLKFLLPQDKVSLRATSFVNAKVKASGELEGLNGDINRYTRINIDAKTVEKEALVVLCRTMKDGVKGFAMSNYLGKVAFLTEEGAVAQVEKRKNKDSAGIANGKLIKKGSVSYLSAISGDYDFKESCSIIDKNVEEAKEMPSELIETWDLSNTNYPITEHIKAIEELPEDKLMGKISKESMLIFIKEKTPSELSILVESENWKEVIALFVNTFSIYKNLFNHSEISFEQFKGLLKQINTDSMKYKDFKEQINTARFSKITPADIVLM